MDDVEYKETEKLCDKITKVYDCGNDEIELYETPKGWVSSVPRYKNTADELYSDAKKSPTESLEDLLSKIEK